jgi:predicted DNA-binding transcriptional regulator YafY
MSGQIEVGRKLVGVKAIADHMGVAERTVRRWCRARAMAGIPILKVGGRYAAFERDLRDWVNRGSR